MLIEVKVTPRAAANRIVEDGDLWRVYVTAAPADGKANKAVVKLLAKHFGVAQADVSIIRGQTGRTKTIEVKLRDGAFD